MNNQKELIPMRSGDLLRLAREKAGLSLERAAELSRIKPSVLAAIEADDTASIASVYLRGYIRNYANALGLDPAEMEDHLAQAQGVEPVVQSVFSVKTDRGRAEKWLKASSYLAASAVIAALVWQFTHEAVRFSLGGSELGQAPAASSAAVEAKGQEPAAQSRPSNTHLSASIAAVEVIQQRGDRGGQAAAEQAWAAISGPGADETAPLAAPEDHRLTVSTSADSWVEILDGKGAQLELDLIRAGQERAYAGTGPFQVMLGRASAVELTLDGEPVDLSPHTRENVARLTLGGETAAGNSETADPVDH
jgi:cytoskeleton protein RodZ